MGIHLRTLFTPVDPPASLQDRFGRIDRLQRFCGDHELVDVIEGEVKRIYPEARQLSHTARCGSFSPWRVYERHKLAPDDLFIVDVREDEEPVQVDNGTVEQRWPNGFPLSHSVAELELRLRLAVNFNVARPEWLEDFVARLRWEESQGRPGNLYLPVNRTREYCDFVGRLTARIESDYDARLVEALLEHEEFLLAEYFYGGDSRCPVPSAFTYYSPMICRGLAELATGPLRKSLDPRVCELIQSKYGIWEGGAGMIVQLMWDRP